jgi:hypothetical protein
MRFILIVIFVLELCKYSYSEQINIISYSGYFYFQPEDLSNDSLKIELIRQKHRIGGNYTFFIDYNRNYNNLIKVLFIDEFVYFKPNPETIYHVKLKKITKNTYQLISCNSFDNISAKNNLNRIRKQVSDSLKLKIFSEQNIIDNFGYDYYYIPKLINLLNDSINQFCLEEIEYFIDPGGPQYKLYCYDVNKFAYRLLRSYLYGFNYPKTLSKKQWIKWYRKL